MSIKDLEPNGFTEQMRHHAAATKDWDFYSQGFFKNDIGIWLRIDGTQTLIGYGSVDEALLEAEAAIRLKLDKLRAELGRRTSPAAAEKGGAA